MRFFGNNSNSDIFGEAIRTNIPAIRHILNWKLVFHVKTAFFYTRFMEKINDTNNKQLNYKEII